MRGNKSLADDLSVRQGAVSSRVALLLRSAEAKPSLPRFVLEKPLLQFAVWLLCEAVRIGGRVVKAWLPSKLPENGSAGDQPVCSEIG